MADQNVMVKYIVPTLSLNTPDGSTRNKLQIQVFDPLGNIFHSTEIDNPAPGYYNFQSTKDLTGYFDICFSSLALGYIEHPLETHITIQVDEDAKEYKKIASKDHLEKLSGLIEQLRDRERMVSQELDFMKSREVEFRHTTNTINDRLVWVHLMLLAVTVIVGLWQVWSMQAWFKLKKLI